MAAEVLPKLTRIGQWLERRHASGEVAIVRQFRLKHQPQLVRSLEELGRFAARMETGEVEARRPRLGDPRTAVLSPRTVPPIYRVYLVESAPAQEERFSIEVEIFSAHLKLAYAEPLAPCLHYGSVLDQLDNARVQIRMFRRPRTESAERKTECERV